MCYRDFGLWNAENHCLSYPVSCNLDDKHWQRVNHEACKRRNKSLQQMFVAGGVLQPAGYGFLHAESVQGERVLGKIRSLHPNSSI